MFDDFADILAGRKDAPEIPFRVEFDLRNTVMVVIIILIAVTLYTLLLKALK